MDYWKLGRSPRLNRSTSNVSPKNNVNIQRHYTIASGQSPKLNARVRHTENMESVRRVAEEIISDGVIERDFAERQILELQRQMHSENSQGQKQGDASRLFLMNLFKLGKITINQLNVYADSFKLMEHKPAPQPLSPQEDQVKSPKSPKPTKKSLKATFSLRRLPVADPGVMSLRRRSDQCPAAVPSGTMTLGRKPDECPVVYPGSPKPGRRKRPSAEPLINQNFVHIETPFANAEPSPSVNTHSSTSSSQSKPIFKVYDMIKDDGQRKLLQFDFSASVLQYIPRNKKVVDIPFDDITHHDVSEGQIVITTAEMTFQLGLHDPTEQDKVKMYLDSIGHDDDLALVEEDVLHQGYLDKKGPAYTLGTKKRFVKVTHGKLSYYKMDSSQSYEAPLNTIVLNPELNEVKRFNNDGFSIVSKTKEEKEFSFMIPKGKLKVDDLVERREEWVSAIKQAYSYTPSSTPQVQRIGSTGAKSSGCHLVNMAKQQMESMLEILKEYEAEDECAAQAMKMHQLLDEIERKLAQNISNSHDIKPITHFSHSKRDRMYTCSNDDLRSNGSFSSNSSIREDRSDRDGATYEEIDYRPQKDTTPTPEHHKPHYPQPQEDIRQTDYTPHPRPPPQRIPPPIPPPEVSETEEETYQEEVDEEDKEEEEDDEEEKEEVEERIYDVVSARPTPASPPTECDGLIDRIKLGERHRARTHANSMVMRPSRTNKQPKGFVQSMYEDSMQMDEIKHAKLSTNTDVCKTPEKTPGTIKVVRDEDLIKEEKVKKNEDLEEPEYDIPRPVSSEKVKTREEFDEDQDIYHVPSLVKPGTPEDPVVKDTTDEDTTTTNEDHVHYDVPSPNKDPGNTICPPSRPVPQLPVSPGLPSRPPPDIPTTSPPPVIPKPTRSPPSPPEPCPQIPPPEPCPQIPEPWPQIPPPEPCPQIPLQRELIYDTIEPTPPVVDIPKPPVGEEDDATYEAFPVPPPLPKTPEPGQDDTIPDKVAPKPDLEPKADSVPPVEDNIYEDTAFSTPELDPPKLDRDPPKLAIPGPPKLPPPSATPTAPKPPGPPRPPSGSILGKPSKYQPQIIPKVKVLPLHWQKIPPISFKKSVWGEMTDQSPIIDVAKLEEFFATKPAAKLLKTTNKNSGDQKNYLDAKRSQNIGIFLHGSSIQPPSVSEIVARINRSDLSSSENITALKKFAPTNEDQAVFSKIPESDVKKLDKADQLMWYMINTPYFTPRLHILEVTISIPNDHDDIKIMIDNILEVCRVLLTSNSFLRFLEKILTIGNMMNASIKKTSPGFKLSTTLPKLTSVKSQDKSHTLLDFIVDQAVQVDGDCLKFVNDLEIVHRSSQCSSIVSLSAEVESMKQDMNKLTGRANELSQYPPDNRHYQDLVAFVADVRDFVKFFQQNVFMLSEQSAKMKSDFHKVLERFGESPNTDSEEFLKTLSEFLTALVDSIKKCSQPLPDCVAHLKPKPKPLTSGKPKQMDIANSLLKSSLFKRSQTELAMSTTNNNNWT